METIKSRMMKNAVDIVNDTPMLFTLKKARWTHWQSTLMWVLYNVLGSFLPLWGTYFLLHLYQVPFHLNDFLKHGEFALIAAAFLAPALQQVVKSIRDSRYVLGTGAVLIAVTGLVVAAMVYSAVFMGSSEPFHAKGIDATKLLNHNFLFRLSNWLLGLSLLFAVVITLIEKVVFEQSAITDSDSSGKQLNAQLDIADPVVATGLIDRSTNEEQSAPESEQDLERAFKEATQKQENAA